MSVHDHALVRAALREVVGRVAKRMRIPCPPDEAIDAMRLPPPTSQERTDAAVELWLAKWHYGVARPTPRERHITGWVYFVRGAGMIKIGTARDVERRVRELRMASPVDLEVLLAIPGSREVEQHMHRRFRTLRAHGEWFRAEAPLLAHIERLRARAERRRS